MTAQTRAWLQIHVCVVLWGFTAILGKLISLSALALVWWRMLLVTGSLLLVRRFWAGLAGMPPRLIATYAGIGVVVALHWITFFGSVKLSNASIAATCLALTPVFLSFVEPLLIGRKFDPRELLFGLAVIPGVILVVGGTPTVMRLGIVVGAISALLVAIFLTLNKRFVGNSDTLSVTGIEMGAGALLLTLSGPLLVDAHSIFVLPTLHDAMWLVLLATVCTILPFALSLMALRHVNAFAVTLVLNLEPVYAIVFAILLLGEQHELTVRFYLGVAIILAVIFAHPLLSRRPLEPVSAPLQ